MAEKIYKVDQEEKLSDIAKRFGTTEEKLKILNPDMRTFGGGFFSKDVYVSVNQYIKVSDGKVIAKSDNEVDFDFNKNQQDRQEKKIDEEHFLQNLTFEQEARYRCEQLNISRINNEIITLSANTYTDFLVKQSEVNKTIFEVDVQDLSFSVDPRAYEEAFKFGQKLEKSDFQ